MPLADAGFVFLVIVLPIVGFVGFFVVVLTLIVKAIASASRMMAGSSTPSSRSAGGAAAGQAMCRAPRCGHVNRHGAVYCARCGTPLGRTRDVDAYG